MVVEVRIVVISVRALTGMGHEGSFRMLEMVYILIWWVIQKQTYKNSPHSALYTFDCTNIKPVTKRKIPVKCP